jgi:predicted GH43/DUF377 family glycosyl hydrolase
MTTTMPAVTRSPLRLLPDPARVLAKPYHPSEDPAAPETRVARLLRQVGGMPDEQVERLLEEVRAGFAHRHRDFDAVMERSFATVAFQLDDGVIPSKERRLLMGAYFTSEYSIESAALFNPSMVPAPDQSGLEPGAQRFLLSLRAVGEGHLSSIEFRSGVVGADGELRLDETGRFVEVGQRRSPLYDKEMFVYKLGELGASTDVVAAVTGPLPPRFTRMELDTSLARLRESDIPPASAHETVNLIAWLADSNYRVRFPADLPVAERVLFPESASESRGMEDARFVRFTDDDGSVRYYATYTAYDGFSILPQLIETADFTDFRIATLNGRSAENKGMALFPRRIGGRFVALSRFDRQNIDVMTSDDVHLWEERDRIRAPIHPWELFQMGNCGSPIETAAGWLVLTHGVGPLRRYCIGALLLDLDDPRRVVADLPEPLLVPEGDEREGYVPNVVYSCGAMLHGGTLVIPYGFSDAGAGFATVDLHDLLTRLLEHPSGA